MLAVICAMGIAIGIYALATAIEWSIVDDIYNEDIVMLGYDC